MRHFALRVGASDMKADRVIFVCGTKEKSFICESIFSDIKKEIEEYPDFILCANGQKGIHIDKVLEIIDKYAGGNIDE